MWLGFREIIGWVIAAIGLMLVFVVLYLAMNRMVFEAMALSLPSLIVFRGGLGLVRLSTAGRIAIESLGSEKSDY